jgi:bifunctional DNase/RNase
MTQRGRVLVAVLALAVVAGCRGHAPDEVEMRVRNVGFDGAAASPVVILEAQAGGLLLPIWIGPSEAQSIAVEMQKMTPARPLTHDLVKRILDHTGVVLRRVRITRLEQQTFFATLVLAQDGREIEVDSRPSDAIALALRASCPILVSREVLESGAVVALRPGGSPDVARLWGVTVQELTSSVADSLGASGIAGVLVSDVDAPAAAAGLRRGDVIVRVDDVPVATLADLRALAECTDGAARTLEVRRRDERASVRLDCASAIPPRG